MKSKLLLMILCIFVSVTTPSHLAIAESELTIDDFTIVVGRMTGSKSKCVIRFYADFASLQDARMYRFGLTHLEPVFNNV